MVSIPLGADPENHKRVRPLMVGVLSQYSDSGRLKEAAHSQNWLKLRIRVTNTLRG